MFRDDLIVHSTSPYNSPTLVVPKKPESSGEIKFRNVTDFRAPNKETIGDACPLLNITDILDQLGGAQYFSVLDLASGFRQIEISVKDQPKTDFFTPQGLY